jgi:hypothetical protein
MYHQYCRTVGTGKLPIGHNLSYFNVPPKPEEPESIILRVWENSGLSLRILEGAGIPMADLENQNVINFDNKVQLKQANLERPHSVCTHKE